MPVANTIFSRTLLSVTFFFVTVPVFESPPKPPPEGAFFLAPKGVWHTDGWRRVGLSPGWAGLLEYVRDEGISVVRMHKVYPLERAGKGEYPLRAVCVSAPAEKHACPAAGYRTGLTKSTT